MVSLAGTAEGHRLAVGLALLAAVLHALFGALQKGRHDPWLARAAIDASYGIIAAPFALFVVPWPEPWMLGVFAGALVPGSYRELPWTFSGDCVVTVRKASRLRDELELDGHALALTLGLLEHVRELEAEISKLRAQQA